MNDTVLDRRTILPILFPKPDEYLFVTGLAGSARDVAGLTHDSDNLFTMAGAMGAAVSMGLGIALSAPDRKVAVVTGDGELLMNLGALITVAAMAPTNLSIICIDNGCHGETGGQHGHTRGKANLVMLAEGAGLDVIKTISTEVELESARQFLTRAEGPRFLVVQVTDGPPTSFSRNMNPAECRVRFRKAFQSA